MSSPSLPSSTSFPDLPLKVTRLVSGVPAEISTSGPLVPRMVVGPLLQMKTLSKERMRREIRGAQGSGLSKLSPLSEPTNVIGPRRASVNAEKSLDVAASAPSRVICSTLARVDDSRAHNNATAIRARPSPAGRAPLREYSDR